jgi:hypothetical protein
MTLVTPADYYEHKHAADVDCTVFASRIKLQADVSSYESIAGFIGSRLCLPAADVSYESIAGLTGSRACLQVAHPIAVLPCCCTAVVAYSDSDHHIRPVIR